VTAAQMAFCRKECEMATGTLLLDWP
jgi:hypothetical protein